MKIKIFYVFCLSSFFMYGDVLYDAVKNKDLILLEQLLNQGIDVHSHDDGLCTERDIELNCKGFNTSHDYMKHFVENIKVNYKSKLNQKTALHYAAEMNFVQGIQLLLQAGADIESKDAFDRMPIKIAVQYNAVQAAEFLLQYYDSLHRPFYILKGLLHDAARVDSYQMIQVLV